MQKKIQTGLFFGSFNPVHTGHLIVASHFIQYSELEEIWFVLSPQNPFKDKAYILDESIRIQLLKLAIDGNPSFRLCETELHLPKPSYTINTLNQLESDYPGREFILLLGEDNLSDFDKWKDYKEIIKKVNIFVYPRGHESSSPFVDDPGFQKINAPRIEISSSMIRETIMQGKDPRYVLPDQVYRQIMLKGYYR